MNTDGSMTLLPEEEQEKKTALTFEISSGGDGGLVFESEADIIPSVTEKIEEARTLDEELLVPDDYADDSTHAAPGFTSDTFNIRATYIPRFTEASENYRIAPASKIAQTVKKAVEEEPLAEIDPTADLEGEGNTNATVVVSARRERGDEYADESISVFKFNGETEDKEEVDEAIELVKDVPVTEETPKEEPPKEDVVEVTSDESESKPHFSIKRRRVYTEREPEPDGVLLARESVKSANGYSSPKEKDSAKDGFLDRLMSLKIRFFVALTLTLAILVFSVGSYFGLDAVATLGLSELDGAVALLSLALSFALFLLALPEYIKAMRVLIKKKFSPELFSLFTFIILLTYCLVVAGLNDREYPDFSVVFAVLTLSVILGSLLRAMADFLSFKLVSKNGIKNVADCKLTRELPRENMAMDGAVDEYKSKTAQIYRTSFVGDFFKNSLTLRENSVNLIISVVLGVVVSFFTALLAYFISFKSFGFACEVFTAVFVTSIPALSVLLHKLPYYLLMRRAVGEGGAFVGEDAVYSASEVDVVTYRDTDVFGEEDVTIRKVHLYGKPFNMAKAMKQMYALFSVVDGPLYQVFASALDKKGESAEDVIIEDGGVSGVVDGHTVFAGSEAYMKSHGIAIPELDGTASAIDSTRVMYGAEDGEVYVKFYIRYSFSEEFTMLLPYLKAEGIYPLIYTRDPNVNNELFKTLTFGEDLIRVIKRNDLELDDKVYPRAVADIVFTGERERIVSLVLLAKKYKRLEARFEVTELIYVFSALLLSVTLSLFGLGYIIPLLFALLHSVGAWVLLALGRFNFRNGK